MDLTCRCNPLLNYTCVACKVKRGDYRDWKCRFCGKEAVRYGLCLAHAEYVEANAGRRTA